MCYCYSWGTYKDKIAKKNSKEVKYYLATYPSSAKQQGEDCNLTHIVGQLGGSIALRQLGVY